MRSRDLVKSWGFQWSMWWAVVFSPSLLSTIPSHGDGLVNKIGFSVFLVVFHMVYKSSFFWKCGGLITISTGMILVVYQP